MLRKIFIAILVIHLIPLFSVAQISEGGQPYSFNDRYVPQDFQVIHLDPPDMTSIRSEDQELDKNGGPMRVAVPVMVNTGLTDAGTSSLLRNGERIWRLKLVAEGAEAMGVYFDDFYLPAGGKLFLYNESGDYVIGAFTSFNNNKNRLFATELIPGDVVVLEYYQPAGTPDKPSVNISEVAYTYRNSGFKNKLTRGSGDCEVNVNCSPEGDAWQAQKRAVARIYVKATGGYFWCTGSLVNNTRKDRKPYFLTANHCGRTATTSDYTQWVFRFNFESEGCEDPGPTPPNQTMTGATLLAHYDEDGSDFKLLLLDQEVPNDYDPYFAGWNREDVAASSGVAIHHPVGDIKKISTYTDPLISSTWNGTPGTHWEVTWVDTENGHGVTEGGSSGAPLFDQEGYVVGTLTGGFAACEPHGLYGPDKPDYFGKFFYDWESNGPTPDQRLKNWLDPDNTGVSTLRGINNFLMADFAANPTTILIDESVNFTDFSSGTPDTYKWIFEGGDPSFSLEQNPEGIVYRNAGSYAVQLIITGEGTSDTLTRIAYIQVVGRVYPNPATDQVNIYLGQKVVSYVKVELFNLAGQRIYTEEISNNSSNIITLDISALHSGAYFIRLTMDQRFSQYRLVKVY